MFSITTQYSLIITNSSSFHRQQGNGR